ncbi:hypothetical protein [Streptomyces glaucescens]|uniref:hypothetical protein n=1 Tax=Streptomyces glaucescens TaxID=1907 RepID=UPI000A3B2422|nr:hypothetical protein [Streptomyces glaucescens]
MDEHREEEPGRGTDPLPRDLPDQQTREGEDPWDVPTGPEGPRATDDSAREEDGGGSADVPDTDEAGTGRRDAPRPGGTDREAPDAPPEESTG